MRQDDISALCANLMACLKNENIIQVKNLESLFQTLGQICGKQKAQLTFDKDLKESLKSGLQILFDTLKKNPNTQILRLIQAFSIHPSAGIFFSVEETDKIIYRIFS